MLAEMASAGLRYAVMEVSSHSLDQGRTDGILFDRAVFTNITSEHLDYHKTLEEYFNAKVRIFDHLKKGGIAILNMDDKRVASLKNRLKCGVISYGTGGRADVTAKAIRLSLERSRFAVRTPEGEFGIDTPLIGRHNISNILAASAVALSEGVPFGDIQKGVRRLDCVPGRLEPIREGQDFNVFVDFAHTADALYNILKLLREASPGKLISVFGCGGNRDRTKRPEMGRMACRLSDHVIITSDNPRHEDPLGIIKEIEAGVKGAYSNYETIGDRRTAIGKALKTASAGDVVVIAGKGHEKYQIIRDRIIPFDDCDVARSILKSKVKGQKSCVLRTSR
jgi:UDP-N-acetylmuramyl-tripeptide synthetase